MNLIDIVWESLVYFGIAAIIVIIISYVSFKMRRKLTGEKFAYEQEIEKKKKEEETKQRKLEARKAKSTKRKKIHTHASDKVRVKQHLKSSGKHKYLPAEDKPKVKFSQKDRLEILNPTQKIQSQSSKSTTEKSTTKESKKEKKLHSLNTNVIEKYGEDEDEFYPIKIKKDKKE